MPSYITNALFDEMREIIRLAEIKDAAESKEEHMESVVLSMEFVPSPERDRLVAKINDLSTKSKVHLMALMRLGQGTIGSDLSRWEELTSEAEGTHPDQLTEELASKGRLHEYLRRGFEMIRC
jgi:hypothetical protein